MNTSGITVLQALSECLRADQPCALATLVAAEGSSPRPLGSQMLLRADGSRVGVISSGCIEASIQAQALEALAEDRPRTLRYGKGSPWLDLQLPCGAGIDVHIAVHHDPQLLLHSLSELSARRQIGWALAPDSGQWQLDPNPMHSAAAQVLFSPQRQLLVIGRGPALPSLAAIAQHSDIAVDCISPDAPLLAQAAPFARHTQLLQHASDFKAPELDRWSGAVLLFHDHDWEPLILQQLLHTRAAYISALGSPHSHALRCEHLRELGLPDDHIGRIKGPAGLDIGAKTPAEIALSIVAEFVQQQAQQP